MIDDLSAFVAAARAREQGEEGGAQVQAVALALADASPQVLQDAITVANCPTIGPSFVTAEGMDALRARGLVDENNVMPDDVTQVVQACVVYTPGEGYHLAGSSPEKDLNSVLVPVF